MKKSIVLYALLFPFLLIAQTDFSKQWDDFYSYNNVKDLKKVDNSIYALVDNAVFIYDIDSKKTKKLSSIDGFSGEITSAIHYSNSTKNLIIAYENGLLEILDENGNIHIAADIVNFDQSGEKSINHMYEYDKKLYLATPFAIVVYDIEKLEFGDTYFIGSGSTSVKINEITIVNNIIYAAAENGLYSANITNNNLIDSNNWTLDFAGNFSHITSFNSKIYTTIGKDLFVVQNGNISAIKTFSSAIVKLQSSLQTLTVSLDKQAISYNANLVETVTINPNSTYNFSLNSAFSTDNILYLGTKEYGVLAIPFSNTSNFTEIHPEGPLSNEVFSITAKKNNLWLVYGGYNSAYVPVGIHQGFSHYNGEKWINTPFNPTYPILDLVHVSIDPTKDNRVFISSYAATNGGNYFSGGGLLEVVDDQLTTFYTSQNSPLEDLFPSDPNRITTRINGTAFDSQGNLWITDALGSKKLKKLSSNNTWKSFDLSSIQTNQAQELNELVVDNLNNIWIGTRRNGVYVFNENGARKRALTTEPTKGSLPNANTRTIAVDRNNRIWIGTQTGLVVFNGANSVFDATIYDAEPVIILDDGIPKKLLGNQTINSIAVDGADNKWFGTDNGGVLYTNPNGQKTLAAFNKDNSPLPSNKILKITVDTSTGKVFFATDKGVVAYNSNVAEFGDVLADVYAYPNPALKNHETITIDGRNGTHLPKGTNVKIVDVSGNLVYETNVVEGQELQGGKVVWNKKNLGGKKVASGIYIVLLSNEDASEKATTKIAIVN